MAVTIVGSYFASLSDFRDPFRSISVINMSGNLNTSLWSKMCRAVANDGADATRQVPYWAVRQDDHAWMPYVFVNSKYDLETFNPRYFTNLRKMAEIANSYNMVFIYSLYDQCHIKPKNRLRLFNPWTNNHQYLMNAWYGEDAGRFRESWQKEIFKTLSGLRVVYEICNEPQGDCYRFITDTLAHIEQHGVHPCDVICGIQYRFENNRNRQYKDFKAKLLNEKGRFFVQQLEKSWLTAVHQCSENDFKDLRKHETGTQRFFLSDDGNVPKNTQEWFYRNYAEYFRRCPGAAFIDRFYIECMFKTRDDDFRSTRGVSRAIKEIKGYYPQNWGQFPEIQVPVEKVRLDRLHQKQPVKQ